MKVAAITSSIFFVVGLKLTTQTELATKPLPDSLLRATEAAHVPPVLPTEKAAIPYGDRGSDSLKNSGSPKLTAPRPADKKEVVE